MERGFEYFRNKVNSSDTSGEVETALAFTKASFPTPPWPDTLYPMSYMNLYVAKVYRSSNDHHQAAIYALQACLGTTTRSGPQWVHFLLMLLMYLRRLMAVSEATGIDTAGPQNLRFFFNGLFNDLLLQSMKAYGVDTKFATALERWYINEIKVSEGPLPGEEGFPERFAEAQASVLEWAGVDEKLGIVLSDVLGEGVMEGDGVDEMEVD